LALGKSDRKTLEPPVARSPGTRQLLLAPSAGAPYLFIPVPPPPSVKKNNYLFGFMEGRGFKITFKVITDWFFCQRFPENKERPLGPL